MAYRQRSLGSGSLQAPDLLKAALVGYEHERTVIVEKIAEIRRQLGGRSNRVATPSTNGAEPARRQMSGEARRRIAAAQRKRWAAFRKEHAPEKTRVQKAGAKPRRTMSAGGRKRIAEAQRKRWATVHAKKAAPKVKAAGA